MVRKALRLCLWEWLGPGGLPGLQNLWRVALRAAVGSTPIHSRLFWSFMSYPEIDVLTSHVSRVFRVEDVTAGEPREWIARYRGSLLNEDERKLCWFETSYNSLVESIIESDYYSSVLEEIKKGNEISSTLIANNLQEQKNLENQSSEILDRIKNLLNILVNTANKVKEGKFANHSKEISQEMIVSVLGEVKD